MTKQSGLAFARGTSDFEKAIFTNEVKDLFVYSETKDFSDNSSSELPEGNEGEAEEKDQGKSEFFIHDHFPFGKWQRLELNNFHNKPNNGEQVSEKLKLGFFDNGDKIL